MKKTSFILFILFSTMFLLGSGIQKPLSVDDDLGFIYEINRNQNFGQSFTSLHTGLNGISINLSTLRPTSNQIIVRLYENISNRKLISEETHTILFEPDKYFHKLTLPLQKTSYLKDYFIEIEWQGDQTLFVQTAPAESYDQGAFYYDSNPQDAQLEFILHYDPFVKILGLVKQFIIWIWDLILTALVFVIPGWAILLFTWKSWSNYDVLIKIATSAAVSFAFYPILMLFTDIIGFHPGEIIYVWFPIITASSYLIWRYRATLNYILTHPKTQWDKLKTLLRSSFSWNEIAMIFIVLLVILIRLWIIRTLQVPLWGDSYQHSMITQLILDNQGLFESWLPYAPYESLTVHFGFHVNSAIFAWISNSTANYAVIWVGQVVNVLAVIGLYPLANRLTRKNDWIGIFVIFVAGLLLKLPVYYVNWGRYPQLIALGLLPVAFFMILETVFLSDMEIKKIFTTSFVLAGMALCYYRSPLFMLIFLPIFITEIIKWQKNTTKKPMWLWKALLILLLTAILLLPIIPRLNQGELIESVSYKQTSPLINQFKTIISGWQSVTNYYHWIFFILAALAVIFAIITKQ